MMNENQILKNRPKGNAGFRVPEGYFEGLTEQVMQRLPEEKPVSLQLTRSRWQIYRPVVLAAASVITAVFSIGIVMHSGHGGTDMAASQSQVSLSQDASTNKVIDQIATYSMMDNEDMYTYMSENY